MLSLLLMTLDHRWPSFHKVRADLSLVVLPIQYLVDVPVHTVANISSFFTSRKTLLHDNNRLRTQQLLLQARLQTLLSLQQENTQLRALLSASSHFKSKSMIANLLAVNLAPFVQQVVINKGKNNGVSVGQPVLDANGVMGRVIAVDALTSQVLLVTDVESAVPIEDSRNGVRGIVVGLGNGELSLIYMPITVDIKIGDVLVTSGLGNYFPEGYPVGVVSSIQHRSDQSFVDIVVKPSADVYRSRQVLLLTK